MIILADTGVLFIILLKTPQHNALINNSVENIENWSNLTNQSTCEKCVQREVSAEKKHNAATGCTLTCNSGTKS